MLTKKMVLFFLLLSSVHLHLLAVNETDFEKHVNTFQYTSLQQFISVQFIEDRISSDDLCFNESFTVIFKLDENGNLEIIGFSKQTIPELGNFFIACTRKFNSLRIEQKPFVQTDEYKQHINKNILLPVMVTLFSANCNNQQKAGKKKVYDVLSKQPKRKWNSVTTVSFEKLKDGLLLTTVKLSSKHR